jgi:hypothetical protein
MATGYRDRSRDNGPGLLTVLLLGALCLCVFGAVVYSFREKHSGEYRPTPAGRAGAGQTSGPLAERRGRTQRDSLAPPDVDALATGTRDSPDEVAPVVDSESVDATDPRPTDPPFLFVTLIAAIKSGDKMLESLARDWLAEVGIRVVFDEDAPCLKIKKG